MSIVPVGTRFDFRLLGEEVFVTEGFGAICNRPDRDDGRNGDDWWFYLPGFWGAVVWSYGKYGIS